MHTTRINYNWQSDTATRIEPLTEADHTAEPVKPLTNGERQDIVRAFCTAGAGLGDKWTPAYFIRHATKPDKEALTQVGYVPVRNRGALLDYFTGIGSTHYAARYVVAAIAAGVPYTPQTIDIKTFAEDPDDNPFA